ncbi:MAG TPA: phospho-N-acetylmuramoyl-pentapeptide-transferase [Candidatus Saccharimonadales bacterium]|nr:phospho-N-acetylmuramoyl-pentapeptide-transferase [Candidatus Saccharimonadales bacterium]
MNPIVSPDFITNLTTVSLLAGAGFFLSMALTPVYTFFAYKYKLWKVPRTVAVTGEKAPVLAKLHAAKHRRNIPMMAGLVFVVVVAVLTLALNLDRSQTWLPLAAFLGGGLVGLIDDIINVRGLGGGIKGLRAPIKFAMVTAVGLLLAWFFYYKLGYTSIHLPFIGDWSIGIWMIPLFAFVVVATGNAVNITDGLDGLAGGLAAMAFGFFGVIALLQGNIGVAGFCFTVVGALLSYVWFNIFPARFFMADVGSFSLGASLGVVAMMTDTLFLLPIIGFVFVADTATVLLQLFSKKVFKRKIFLSSPVHHHFEAIGWPEAKVTMRFWVVGQVCGVIGLVIALVGGYIK